MGTERTRRREDRVIDELCSFLAQLDGGEVVRLSHPDREPGGHGGCDAIILRSGERVAVEHTSIHEVPDKPGHLVRLEALRPLLIKPIVAAFPARRVMLIVATDDVRRDRMHIADRVVAACTERLTKLASDEWAELPAIDGVLRVSVWWIPSGVRRGSCHVRPGTCLEWDHSWQAEGSQVHLRRRGSRTRAPRW